MTDVSFSASGPPETTLPEHDPELTRRLAADEPAAVATAFPGEPVVWSALGEEAETARRPPIEAYAYFRVGYHRGLDQLRKHGWKGSGYVRWAHVPNQGFLRCLSGLARMATEIGENEEAERCRVFLHQLDPDRFEPVRPTNPPH
ncbi:DUF3151 domain-containing protein [soil metagenome]